MMNRLLNKDFLQYIFDEDGYYGDPASALISPDQVSTFLVKCKQKGIFCGERIIRECCEFTQMHHWDCLKKDGDSIEVNDVVASITGFTQDILQLERVLLNFIAFASGIATKTKQYTEIIDSYGVRLLDTRKTLPGLRKISKYAVKTGGGWNHRFNLSDLIMLKDNHVNLLGGIKPALKKLSDTNRQAYTQTEIEVSNLKQALEALAFNPDVIMLDNFTPDQVQEVMFYLKGKVLVEISGGVTLENIEDYAKAKPDFISTGRVTQQIDPIDFNMKMES